MKEEEQEHLVMFILRTVQLLFLPNFGFISSVFKYNHENKQKKKDSILTVKLSDTEEGKDQPAGDRHSFSSSGSLTSASKTRFTDIISTGRLSPKKQARNNFSFISTASVVFLSGQPIPVIWNDFSLRTSPAYRQLDVCNQTSDNKWWRWCGGDRGFEPHTEHGYEGPVRDKVDTKVPLWHIKYF